MHSHSINFLPLLQTGYLTHFPFDTHSHLIPTTTHKLFVYPTWPYHSNTYPQSTLYWIWQLGTVGFSRSRCLSCIKFILHEHNQGQLWTSSSAPEAHKYPKEFSTILPDFIRRRITLWSPKHGYRVLWND